MTRGTLVRWALLALAGLGALYALVAGSAGWGPHCHSRATIARVHLRNLGAAVDLYRKVHGAFPESLETLTRVSDHPPEPYLAELPLDPWEGRYVYQVEGKRFTVRSAGEDGQLGTEDDLVWPDPT